MTLFRPGETCWRTAHANRVAFLIASEAYFTAAFEAMRKARRSILLLGWTFDPRTRLAPDGHVGPADPDEVGRVLLRLADARPDLDIRLLIWNAPMLFTAGKDFYPRRAARWFEGGPIKFRLDDSLPLGACHHQKVLVIDDQLAFCGGGDISVDRWDSWRHLSQDSRRALPNRALHAPRHEMMMMVDGDAARALGEHFRERWRRVDPEPVAASEDRGELWPLHVTPHLTDAEVAIARTAPAWGGEPAVAEIRRLTLECIARARETIYLESQYFTSPLVTEALAARLAEPHGPEVVLISTGQAPSWFDQLTMDRARGGMLARLRAADGFGRFRALSPRTADGTNIIVHSKCGIFDDRVVRVGSANLNNRSFGFDTECELAAQVSSQAARREIRAFSNRLVGHFLGATGETVASARAEHGGLARAIDALSGNGRLLPIPERNLSRWERFASAYHVGDPVDADDAWRLHRRHARLTRQARHILQGRRGGKGAFDAGDSSGADRDPPAGED